MTDMDRLLALRAELFAAIKESLEQDGHCKHYEGAFSVVMPNYFEQIEADAWQVNLDCYIIGPNRHYYWRGDTFADAITKAERDVRMWIAEAKDEE